MRSTAMICVQYPDEGNSYPQTGQVLLLDFISMAQEGHSFVLDMRSIEECKMLNSEFRIQNLEFRIQNRPRPTTYHLLLTPHVFNHLINLPHAVLGSGLEGAASTTSSSTSRRFFTAFVG